MKTALRRAVEESVLVLAQKLISACEDNRPEDAARYASGMDDACRALSNLSDAERES